MSLREAATRVFSNASGSYSSNVNLAVENSSWQDEQQLQEMYLKRKSFAFNSDRCAWLAILLWMLIQIAPWCWRHLSYANHSPAQQGLCGQTLSSPA